MIKAQRVIDYISTIDEKIKKDIPFEDVESAYINLDVYFAQCLDREKEYKEVLERCFLTALDCMKAVTEIHGKIKMLEAEENMNKKYCSLSKGCEENDHETCLVWLAYQNGKEEGLAEATEKLTAQPDDGRFGD